MGKPPRRIRRPTRKLIEGLYPDPSRITPSYNDFSPEQGSSPLANRGLQQGNLDRQDRILGLTPTSECSPVTVPIVSTSLQVSTQDLGRVEVEHREAASREGSSLPILETSDEAGISSDEGRPSDREIDPEPFRRSGFDDEINYLDSKAITEKPPHGQHRVYLKGPRKPLEPSAEFKQLHSQATGAFIDGDLASAESLAQAAIQSNPEIFTAHSLLSEIYVAQGDTARATTALFHGAHTRPRDVGVWLKVAELILEYGGDRQSRIEDAIYCYNRVIAADKNHSAARIERARLNIDIGKNTRAAYDYAKVLVGSPERVDILRNLVELYVELGEHERAVNAYDRTIAALQNMKALRESLTWSDINIYGELLVASGKPDKALLKLKHVCRYLQGRENESFWERWHGDDREFDLHDNPRRLEMLSFIPQNFPESSYGEELPLELRNKLGILRLAQGAEHFGEALSHFEWLKPDAQDAETKVFDYPDLYRDAADALRLRGYFEQALRFYVPIQRAEPVTDAAYFADMATCHRQLGKTDRAEEYYRTFLEMSESGDVIWGEMASIFHPQNTASPEAFPMSIQFPTSDATSAVENTLENDITMDDVQDPSMGRAGQHPLGESLADSIFDSPLVKRRAKIRRRAALSLEDDLSPVFSKLNDLSLRARTGDKILRVKWMSTASSLVYSLSQTKGFKSFGRALKSGEDLMEARARPTVQTAPQAGALDDRLLCKVSLRDWLDLLLQQSIFLAEDGRAEASFRLCKAASSSAHWNSRKEWMFLIYLTWSVCALICKDHEALSFASRFFMRDSRFTPDSYRLYAALHRFFDGPNPSYNDGPSQKYILRQIRVMDAAITTENTVTSESGLENILTASRKQNIALLMLYGHIMTASGSHTNALPYFLRARSLDPENPLINLSLGLAYMHHALKRQAGNRHLLILQSLSFFFAYRERRSSGTVDEKQEAEFNVGRAFHMIGLAHLAVPYYERCLEMDKQIHQGDSAYNKNNFTLDAAYALQGIWAASGNVEKALEVVEKWMVV